MPPFSQSLLALAAAAGAGGWSRDLIAPLASELLRAGLSLWTTRDLEAGQGVPLEPADEIVIEYPGAREPQVAICECRLEDAVAELDVVRQLLVSTVLRDDLPRGLAVGAVAGAFLLMLSCRCVGGRTPRRRATRRRLASSSRELESW